jgi:hypothetical protein
LLAKILPSNTNGEPLRFIDFAAPISSVDGQVVDVLGAHAHWSGVTTIVQSAVSHSDMSADTQVLIVNQDGLILYPEQLAGQQQNEMPGSLLALSSPMPNC